MTSSTQGAQGGLGSKAAINTDNLHQTDAFLTEAWKYLLNLKHGGQDSIRQEKGDLILLFNAQQNGDLKSTTIPEAVSQHVSIDASSEVLLSDGVRRNKSLVISF